MDSSDDSFVWSNASSDSDSVTCNKMKQEDLNVELDQDNFLSNTPDSTHNSSKRKKAKKRKREESVDSSEQSAKNNFELETEKGINNTTLSSDESYLNVTVQEAVNNTVCETQKTKKKRKNKEINETLIDDTFVDSHINNTNDHSQDNVAVEKINNNLEPNVTPKKVFKISERIRFENENSLNCNETRKSIDTNTNLQSSADITFYQSQNKHLVLSKIKNNPEHSSDEEEWILNCPSEVNINDFENMDLAMDGKNKIKIGGKTYIRSVEVLNSLSKVTFKNNRAIIIHSTAVEVHRYAKKIPKLHMPLNGILVNNQTNFIPLPDTKCRHPLFGVNYKKAIKVRKPNPNIEGDVSLVTKSRKKKHKNEKATVEEEAELDPSTSTSVEHEIVKKKKKRKHSRTEETLNKSKKIKMETESWDTEGAIENKLFNF